LVAWGSVIVACRFQVVPERANTYTAPLSEFVKGASTTTVD
jgi:hypothetical protein